MTEVVRAGIAETRVGRSGGYRLARDPASISLLEVVEAVEGDPRRRVCVFSNSPCLRDGECDVHAVFAAAQDALLAELADVDHRGACGPRSEREPATTRR